MKNHFLRIAVLNLGAMLIAACNAPKKDTSTTEPVKDSVAAVASISETSFGTLPDGTPLKLFKLRNASGMEADITNYGGIITSIRTADRNGKFEDVVLGYDSLAGYLKAPSFFGALVGRYGNRIAKGKFKLDGKTYTLVQNNGKNHLHGGKVGFDKVVWAPVASSTPDSASLKLTYLSKDMEEGYPGNLQVTVTYTLTNDNELKIYYEATTDKPTVVNLTNHSYFNLTGNTKRNILGHTLQLNASKFVPVDDGLIPTGEIKPVKGTPFDFTQPAVIGARINDNDAQIKIGRGYDHCYVFDKPLGSYAHIATLSDSTSGRQMDVFTSEPGTQLYSGNFLDGSVTGKFNTVYAQRYAVCLETQHFPDSPNKPEFPSVVLKPGEVYKTRTTYQFSAK
ncbi:aldose epimerase family protein [Chryseolinea sp. T2]|uniref:aldose epimerase family protein n=1 Tax=Chryseolinea sp. T2 TaxID=3129255 RepID=UPI0030777A72